MMAVTMRINKEHDGIELLFPNSERPNESTRNALKEHGFRWHNKGKYWFARQNPERLQFAQRLCGVAEKTADIPKSTEKQSDAAVKPRSAAKAAKQENTFAASYDSIGNCKILDASNMEFHNIPSSGVYCKATNAFFRHTWGYGDCISVMDLSNAGKTGKNCTIWRLYPEDYNGHVSNALTGEENIHNCGQLIRALREGRTLESLKVNTSEDKGIDTFSPFIEAKPLSKLPDEWNKRNLTSALLSGQIYMGQVDYHYTDDYAMDAANQFGEGVGIDIPNFVRDTVENWSSTNYVRMGTKDAEKGTCTIRFSEHTNSGKTLHFDLYCNIREGKRRAEERSAGIEAYNKMMKASCIQISPESIDVNKIYNVTSLDMNANTGIYGTESKLIQGAALQECFREDWRYMDVLSASEQEIVPDKLYEIGSFYHSRRFAEPDDRIIDFGNSQQLVTGKALLELTAEGVSLPHIVEAYGENQTIEMARENLSKFIRGERSFLITGLQDGGFENSLDKLNREAVRAGHGQRSRSSVNDLIASAQKKAEQQHSGGNEKIMDMSR